MDTIETAAIRCKEPFNNLFPYKEEVCQAIQASMEQMGYDRSEPLVLGDWGDGPYVVDGNMRYKAACRANIEDIPAILIMFDTEGDALQYAIKRQRDRRSLTKEEIFRCIEALDRRHPHGGDRTSETFQLHNEAMKKEGRRSSEETASLLGTSHATVERARTVIDHGDDEIKEAVRSGEMSIGGGYKETQRRRRTKSQPASPEEPIDPQLEVEKLASDAYSSFETFRQEIEALPDDDEWVREILARDLPEWIQVELSKRSAA